MDKLEVAMKCAPHQPGALRIRGVWAMGKGMGRQEVATFCNVHEKTVMEWIKRFNSEGLDGLTDKPRSGAPRRICKEEMLAHVLPLLDGPASVGQEHWTVIKLRGYLTRDTWNSQREDFSKKMRGWIDDPKVEL